MKKIFLAIVAVAAITFSACNGTVKGEQNTDTIATDSIVAEAPEADADAKSTVEGAAADAAQKANDAAAAAADKAKEDAGKAIDKAASDVKGKLGL